MVGADELQDRIDVLGKEITADYEGRVPLLVGVLKGAFMFMSDLSRAIELPLEIDFMAVSSYGHATKTSGVVRITKDLDVDLTGRHVILVEDIVHSGLTLSYVRKNLLARNPASLPSGDPTSKFDRNCPSRTAMRASARSRGTPHASWSVADSSGERSSTLSWPSC